LFTFLDFGFSTSVVKYIAQFRGSEDKENLKSFATTLQVVYILMAAVAATGVSILAWNFTEWFEVPVELHSASRWVVFCLGIRMALNFPYSFFKGVLFGHKNMATVNAIKISELVLNGVATYVLLSRGYGLKALAVSTLAVSAFHYAVLAIYTMVKHADIRLSPSSFRFSLLSEVTSFSFFAFLVNVSIMIITRIDILVIKYFMPLSAIAIYSIGLKLCDYTLGFSKQFINTLTPMIAELKGAGDKDAIAKLYLKGTRFALFISVPIVFALSVYVPEIILYWIGPGFEGAIPVARLLLFTSLISLTQASGSNVLAMTGEHKFLALVTFGSATVNLLLSIAFVQQFGLFGVAFATTVTAFVMDVCITLPRVLKHVDISAKHLIYKAILPVVIPAGSMFAILIGARYILPPSGLISVGINCLAGGLVYLPMVWLLSFTANEKKHYTAKALKAIEKIRGSSAKLELA
jgi:O-antigen/teichoic acid export membrane protein